MTNELYLVVLPLIHMGSSFGLTEQTLTLSPSREFATRFFSDEVDDYFHLFDSRANEYLIGGHVTHYELHKERVPDGRFIVKVIQHVR